MIPVPVPTILSLVEWAIQEEPAVAASLKNIFSKPDPTPADWAAERAQWQQSYRDLVPDTKLPPDSTPPGTPTTPPTTPTPPAA